MFSLIDAPHPPILNHNMPNKQLSLNTYIREEVTAARDSMHSDRDLWHILNKDHATPDVLLCLTHHLLHIRTCTHCATHIWNPASQVCQKVRNKYHTVETINYILIE